MKWDLNELKSMSDGLYNTVKSDFDKDTLEVMVSAYTKIITGIGLMLFARDSIEYNTIENFCLSCNLYLNNNEKKDDYLLDASNRLDEIRNIQIIN